MQDIYDIHRFSYFGNKYMDSEYEEFAESFESALADHLGHTCFREIDHWPRADNDACYKVVREDGELRIFEYFNPDK